MEIFKLSTRGKKRARKTSDPELSARHNHPNFKHIPSCPILSQENTADLVTPKSTLTCNHLDFSCKSLRSLSRFDRHLGFIFFSIRSSITSYHSHVELLSRRGHYCTIGKFSSIAYANFFLTSTLNFYSNHSFQNQRTYFPSQYNTAVDQDSLGKRPDCARSIRSRFISDAYELTKLVHEQSYQGFGSVFSKSSPGYFPDFQTLDRSKLMCCASYLILETTCISSWYNYLRVKLWWLNHSVVQPTLYIHSVYLFSHLNSQEQSWGIQYYPSVLIFCTMAMVLYCTIVQLNNRSRTSFIESLRLNKVFNQLLKRNLPHVQNKGVYQDRVYVLNDALDYFSTDLHTVQTRHSGIYPNPVLSHSSHRKFSHSRTTSFIVVNNVVINNIRMSHTENLEGKSFMKRNHRHQRNYFEENDDLVYVEEYDRNMERIQQGNTLGERGAFQGLEDEAINEGSSQDEKDCPKESNLDLDQASVVKDFDSTGDDTPNHRKENQITSSNFKNTNFAKKYDQLKELKLGSIMDPDTLTWRDNVEVDTDYVNLNNHTGESIKFQQYLHGKTQFSRENKYLNDLLNYEGKNPVRAAQITLVHKIKQLGLQGKWKKTIELLHRTRMNNRFPLNTFIYTAVISACSRSKRWKEAVLILRIMQQDHIEVTEVTYNSCLSACARAGQVQTALMLLSEMESDESNMASVVSYNSCMQACTNANNLEAAWSVLQRCFSAGVQPDVITYSTLMNALAKQGLWKECVELLEKMRRKAKRENGFGSQQVAPNLTTYNTCIRACVQHGKLDVALELFDQLLHEGYYPSDITFTFLISTCKSQANCKMAVNILHKMSEYGLKPNIYSYSACITTCEKAKNYELALLLFDQLKKDGLKANVVTYSALISTCEKVREWKKALILLNEMQSEGISPNVVTYAACISACEKAGKWRIALRLLRSMDQAKVKPNRICYNATISACAREGRLDQACKILEEMKDSRDSSLSPDTISYNACIQACCAGLDWVTALDLLREMKEAGVTANVISYTTAINVCYKSQQWNQVLGLLYEMELEGIPPNIITYTAAIGSSMECNASATDILHEFMAAPDLKWDAGAYHTCLDLCLREGLWKEACELASRLASSEREDVDPDQNREVSAYVCMTTSLYNKIIYACERAKQWEAIIDTFKYTKEITPNIATYTVWLEACKQLGLDEEIVRLKQKLKMQYISGEMDS